MKALFIVLTLLLLIYPASRIARPLEYVPPAASARVVAGINFSGAVPISEHYRLEFDKCDRLNIFNGIQMKGFRRCSTDPNRVRAFLMFSDGTVFFESKLGLDIDGSRKACNSPGSADMCSTWFTWDGLSGNSRFVDSDKFPYIVIPIAGKNGRDDREFRDKTGINKGDLGVVIFKDKVVPVFVADGGPHNKLGEGSEALLKALGEDRCRQMSADGHCNSYRDQSVERGVLFFLFPNSKIPGLTPANALEKIRAEAMNRFERLKHL